MKKIEEIQLPEELRYSPDHEWVRPEGDLARVGLTDYAQDQLGDIVYVELPSIGAHIAQGAVFATVESVKSVSECFMPLAGEVAAVNVPLADNPVLLNQSPYGDGWMVMVKPDDPSAVSQLLTAAGYLARLKGGV
ncbi:MAG: glycine cleavage system protein H [Syntrophus sp. RIFOXYC2_FULL_54_9]|nr:MAG: glycine cleavage system protein H [Syntrophus sp. RIFOXYC2_FULL_54_9]HBB17350.1 glycine cleavage system protein GcvH [Syntrophus sp. (in: bacteria)]